MSYDSWKTTDPTEEYQSDSDPGDTMLTVVEALATTLRSLQFTTDLLRSARPNSVNIAEDILRSRSIISRILRTCLPNQWYTELSEDSNPHDELLFTIQRGAQCWRVKVTPSFCGRMDMTVTLIGVSDLSQEYLGHIAGDIEQDLFLSLTNAISYAAMNSFYEGRPTRRFEEPTDLPTTEKVAQ